MDFINFSSEYESLNQFNKQGLTTVKYNLMKFYDYFQLIFSNTAKQF
jgi:hypothetical protein